MKIKIGVFCFGLVVYLCNLSIFSSMCVLFLSGIFIFVGFYIPVETGS